MFLVEGGYCGGGGVEIGGVDRGSCCFCSEASGLLGIDVEW